MPLFYQKTLNEHCKLAIWEITEPEDFFSKRVTLSKNISHPKKRLQHLAGRYLLQFLEPELQLKEVMISDSGKPFLPKKHGHLSISHCGDYAGVITSRSRNVGIDLEIISPKTKSLRHKFLNKDEEELLLRLNEPQKELNLLTLLWSAKETMFKWYGKGSVDFRKNLLINSIDRKRNSIEACFYKENAEPLTLQFKFFGDLCLVWTCN